MVERGFPVLVWVYFNDKSLMVAVFLFVCVCVFLSFLVCLFLLKGIGDNTLLFLDCFRHSLSTTFI